MKREEFNHFYKLAVRFGDADVLGHINNTEFLRYLECGRVAYCADVLDMIYSKDLAEGWVLVDIQCSFLQQLHYPCEVEIGSRLSKIGNSSAEMEAAIYRVGEDVPVATSKAIFVWFDFVGQTKKRVPDEARERIKNFEFISPI